MPLLSIVIPTKNRYEYLFPVLDASIQYIAGSDYEIVVQYNTHDNSPAIEYRLIRVSSIFIRPNLWI